MCADLKCCGPHLTPVRRTAVAPDRDLHKRTQTSVNRAQQASRITTIKADARSDAAGRGTCLQTRGNSRAEVSVPEAVPVSAFLVFSFPPPPPDPQRVMSERSLFVPRASGRTSLHTDTSAEKTMTDTD